jgi:hypothetical protein
MPRQHVPESRRVNFYITPEAYEMLEDLRTRLHPTFVRSASEVIDTAIRQLHRRMRREQERTAEHDAP